MHLHGHYPNPLNRMYFGAFKEGIRIYISSTMALSSMKALGNVKKKNSYTKAFS